MKGENERNRQNRRASLLLEEVSVRLGTKIGDGRDRVTSRVVTMSYLRVPYLSTYVLITLLSPIQSF